MTPGSQRVARTVLVLAAALACAQSEPSRTLYQWTDEASDVRYTAFPDRIPQAARDTAIPLTPGATAEENAAFAGTPLPPPEPLEADPLALPSVEAAETTDAIETVETIEALEAADAVETTAAIEAVETTEALEATDAGEATEALDGVGATDALEAADAVEATEVLEATDAAEAREFDDIEESTEALEAVGALEAGETTGGAPDSYSLEALDRRISLVEAQVESDQEALKSLIANPDVPELRTSAELREISERLPALQAELETLRRRRESAESDDDGA